MAKIEKVKLMHKFSPEHLRIWTTRLKYDKETGEEGMKINMNVKKVQQVLKKSRWHDSPKSPKLIRSRQSHTTVHLELLPVQSCRDLST